MSTREEDFAKDIFTASTHDTILFFSDRGKVYKLKGYQIPETGRSAKGMNIVNLLELESGEKITAMFPIQEFADDKFLFFVTRQGIAKRIVLSDLQNIRRAGLRALNLNEDDALVDVRLTDGEQNILIATHEARPSALTRTRFVQWAVWLPACAASSWLRAITLSARRVPARTHMCSPLPRTATASAPRSRSSPCIIAAAAA